MTTFCKASGASWGSQISRRAYVSRSRSIGLSSARKRSASDVAVSRMSGLYMDKVSCGSLFYNHFHAGDAAGDPAAAKVPPPTTSVSPCIGGQNLSPAPVLECWHRVTPILKETAQPSLSNPQPPAVASYQATLSGHQAPPPASRPSAPQSLAWFASSLARSASSLSDLGNGFLARSGGMRDTTLYDGPPKAQGAGFDR